MSDDKNKLKLDQLIRASVEIAKFHRALYEAYVEQGFTEAQALVLVVEQSKSMLEKRERR